MGADDGVDDHGAHTAPDARKIDATATGIDEQLRAAGTTERAAKEAAYLKSSLTHYGTSVPDMRRITKRAVSGLDLQRDQLISLVRSLWARPVHECRMAAVEVLRDGTTKLEPSDLDLVEQLLREARTWALVDDLAARVAGALVEAHPGLALTLDRWAGDDDFWVRRSALLALLVPLRRGDGDFDRLGRYADAMLDDPEFYIRKAIGWVLRDTARRRPDLVFAWLLPRAGRASTVTIREAVKPLNPSQRAEILAAR